METQTQEKWQCTDCMVSVDRDFELCWNCCKPKSIAQKTVLFEQSTDELDQYDQFCCWQCIHPISDVQEFCDNCGACVGQYATIGSIRAECQFHGEVLKHSLKHGSPSWLKAVYFLLFLSIAPSCCVVALILLVALKLIRFCKWLAQNLTDEFRPLDEILSEGHYETTM